MKINQFYTKKVYNLQLFLTWKQNKKISFDYKIIY